MTRFEEINSILYPLLDEIKPLMRQEHFRDIRESLEAGEPGLALETICERLYEFQPRISQRIYDGLAQAGSLTDISDRLWKMLLPQVSVGKAPD